MKTAIELLEDAEKKVFCISVHGDKRRNAEYRNMACDLILRAIDKLKSSRWETPEQWKKRTGKAWLDDWGVYFNAWFRENGKPIFTDGKWNIVRLEEARCSEKSLKESQHVHFTVAIICATEAGPPPDDWRPEEDNR